MAREWKGTWKSKAAGLPRGILASSAAAVDLAITRCKPVLGVPCTYAPMPEIRQECMYTVAFRVGGKASLASRLIGHAPHGGKAIAGMALSSKHAKWVFDCKSARVCVKREFPQDWSNPNPSVLACSMYASVYMTPWTFVCMYPKNPTDIFCRIFHVLIPSRLKGMSMGIRLGAST
jgi:hypothetical protein